MPEWSSLGSDEFTTPVMLRLLAVSLIGSFVIWNIVNVPAQLFFGVVFGFMLTFSFIWVILDRLVKNKEYIDTVLEEDLPDMLSWVGGKGKVAIAVFFFFFSMFQVLNTQQSIIGVPTFQVAEVVNTPIFKAFLSGVAGIVENFFFFGIWFPTFYALGSRKLPVLASLPLAIILISTMFAVYHFYVYGTADIQSTVNVFTFAAINSVIVYAFRSLLISDAWHFANNFFINLFVVFKVGFGA